MYTLFALLPAYILKYDRYFVLKIRNVINFSVYYTYTYVRTYIVIISTPYLMLYKYTNESTLFNTVLQREREQSFPMYFCLLNMNPLFKFGYHVTIFRKMTSKRPTMTI